jgi:hypothetical protein
LQALPCLGFWNQLFEQLRENYTITYKFVAHTRRVPPLLHSRSSLFPRFYLMTLCRLHKLHVPGDCISNGRFGKETGHKPIPTFPEEPDELP